MLGRGRTAVRAALVASCLAGGLLAGSSGATVSSAAGDPPNPPAPEGPGTTRWPRNVRGLTYGSGLDSVSPQDEPDLIQAIATNGTVGYVLRTDIEQEPSTPQEALAQQAAQAGHDQVVPVYAADGATKVGVFVVTHPGGSAGPPPGR